MIAPVRVAVVRRVTALIDARLSSLADRSISIPPHRRHDAEWQALSLRLVDEYSHPNPDALWVILRDLENAKLTIKFFGYELGRALSEALPPRPGLVAKHVGLHSKPSTQADLESDWAAYWIGEIKSAHIFHRKLWEFAYCTSGDIRKWAFISRRSWVGIWLWVRTSSQLLCQPRN